MVALSAGFGLPNWVRGLGLRSYHDKVSRKKKGCAVCRVWAAQQAQKGVCAGFPAWRCARRAAVPGGASILLPLQVYFSVKVHPSCKCTLVCSRSSNVPTHLSCNCTRRAHVGCNIALLTSLQWGLLVVVKDHLYGYNLVDGIPCTAMHWHSARSANQCTPPLTNDERQSVC